MVIWIVHIILLWVSLIFSPQTVCFRTPVIKTKPSNTPRLNSMFVLMINLLLFPFSCYYCPLDWSCGVCVVYQIVLSVQISPVTMSPMYLLKQLVPGHRDQLIQHRFHSRSRGVKACELFVYLGGVVLISHVHCHLLINKKKSYKTVLLPQSI